MNFELIYPAIIVFLLMFVGIFLTYLEFKNLEKEEPYPGEKSETEK